MSGLCAVQEQKTAVETHRRGSKARPRIGMNNANEEKIIPRTPFRLPRVSTIKIRRLREVRGLEGDGAARSQDLVIRSQQLHTPADEWWRA